MLRRFAIRVGLKMGFMQGMQYAIHVPREQTRDHFVHRYTLVRPLRDFEVVLWALNPWFLHNFTVPPFRDPG